MNRMFFLKRNPHRDSFLSGDFDEYVCRADGQEETVDMRDEIIREIQAIIANNIGKIDALYEMDGGMEGWFQVELAYALSQKYGQDNVVRERRYPGGEEQYCDIVLSNGTEEGWIELKVDGGNRDSIILLFWADYDKLANLSGDNVLKYAILISRNGYVGEFDSQCVTCERGYNIIVVEA